MSGSGSSRSKPKALKLATSHRKKKRDKAVPEPEPQPQAELTNNMLTRCFLLQLSDDLLLKILGNVDIKSLCMASQTCSRVWRVSRDREVLDVIDLRQYVIDLRKMWKVVRGKVTPALKTFCVKGFLQSPHKRQVLSDALLTSLHERAPRMTSLVVVDEDLTTISPRLFVSPRLAEVELRHCMTSRGLMDTVLGLPVLTRLDLTRCVRVKDEWLEGCGDASLLRCVSLRHCYRVGNKACEYLAKLPQLRELDLGGTAVGALGLHHIGRGCPRLTHLSLGEAAGVTLGAYAELTSLPDLRVIQLADPRDVNAKVKDILRGFPALRRVLNCPEEKDVGDFLAEGCGSNSGGV